MMGYSRVRSEVESSQPSFNPRSLMERRPKHLSKSKLSHNLYGAKPSKPLKTVKVISFRKHLHVFDYMGKNAPSSFSRCDRKIVVSGLLEPIEVVAFEHEVREEILAVINEADVADMNLFATLA